MESSKDEKEVVPLDFDEFYRKMYPENFEPAKPEASILDTEVKSNLISADSGLLSLDSYIAPEPIQTNEKMSLNYRDNNVVGIENSHKELEKIQPIPVHQDQYARTNYLNISQLEEADPYMHKDGNIVYDSSGYNHMGLRPIDQQEQLSSYYHQNIISSPQEMIKPYPVDRIREDEKDELKPINYLSH